ncbi:MAG: hypothetical protein GWN07_22530, partial [Actinobacteria bacterium]|nr:hypothetical protein [Actinomycetota bacterium]NIS33261.1 hypothetical protein [Actinomycetota bacterium]NIT96768.1 hypothetical protein [Actinomycetota bacterium]NIU68170.1 hypothetical protein [Actinomycetota bacterium]NIV56932.1 hypothetical protein [Actinomycetota bacterium]
ELGTDGDITDRLDAVTTDQSGGLEIVVPPFGAVVLRAEAPIPPSAAAPSINFSRPTE